MSPSSFWTSKRVFVVTLLCCFIFVQVSHAEVKFDAGSTSLAKTWLDVKAGLPHDKIPSDPEEIKDAGSWGMDYGIGLVKIVGPGFAIAILSLLAGIIYGIFKLIRMCCCGKSKDEESDSDDDVDPFTWNQKWIPTILYFVFFIFLLTGMIFGLLNNPRFSEGVNDMGDSVILVGNQAIDLGNGLNTNVSSIVALIPTSINNLRDQFSGIDELADEVVELSVDINSTSSQVDAITTKIGQINITDDSVDALYKQLASINNSSSQIIGQVSDLTFQIADKLRSTYNDTVGSLDSKVGDINETVDGLQETARDIITQAEDLVDDVIGFVNDGKSYDKKRGSAVMALFILIIVMSFVIVAGYIFKAKPIFNIVAAFGFVFLFLLWFSGSIHFMLGMVLYDACPVIDPTVKGLLPKDSQAAVVLEGCLYEHRSVLDSLNISAYNLSEVFDYRSQFQEISEFSSGYNFSAIDDYFDSIHNLYSYNLSAVAENITRRNEEVRVEAMIQFNNLTYPEVYDYSNYSDARPSDYSYPKNDTVYNAKLGLDAVVDASNQTAIATQQLISAQADIDVLLANMTSFENRYDNIKVSIDVLTNQSIVNSIAILDNLQSSINNFFDLGNCSFLGDAYVNIRTSLCESMQPAIDLLTVAQFLAGLALIPMVILAEVLSFRIPKCKNLNPLMFNDDDDDDYDEEKGYKKSISPNNNDSEFKLREKRDPGMSATISAEPPASRSTTSSPDFSAGRKNKVRPASTDIPLIQNHQNFILP